MEKMKTRRVRVGDVHNFRDGRLRGGITRQTTCWVVVPLLLLLVCSWQQAWGQAQNTGTVSGNITDTTGALIPNASVTLTSLSTGQVTHGIANGRGEYLLNDVQVGHYQLQVNAPGFGAFLVKNVAVDADQNVRIDAHLKPGTVEASVVVEESGTTVDTRSATIGVLIDQKLIEGLPIDSNNIVALAGLLPGVVNVNAPTTFTSDTGGPTYNTSGSRGNQNLMLFDGMMWNNVTWNTGLNYPPSQALQEVSVLLNNYKAQYGRNAGSVFNVITKSGSNEFHGTVWEFFQNRALDAADYMSHVNPKLVQNQFGGTVGGPVLKNRAFFFASYQDLRIAQQVTAQDFLFTSHERGLEADGTPHQCSSTGAFAGHTCASFEEDATAASASTADRYLHNPLYNEPIFAANIFNTAYHLAGNAGTSPCIALLQHALNVAPAATPYFVPGSEIPSECFNPVAQQIEQEYIPMSVPYTGSFTDPSPRASLPATTSAAPQPRNDQTFLIRGDLHVKAHSIDMRYYWQGANDLTSNSVSQGQGIADYAIDHNLSSLQFGSIGDTWILRGNLLNVLRAGYKRHTYTIDPADPTNLADLGANIALPAKPVMPQINVYNRFNVGGQSSSYTHTINESLQFDDNFSWMRGTHNFQFGASWWHLQTESARDFPGAYWFEQSLYSNVSAADFLMGLLYQEQQQNTVHYDAISPNLYLYAQDDWRVSSRLTLNYGVRYEIPYMWRAPQGRSATFIPGYQSQVFSTAPANLAYVGDHGINSTLVPTPYKDVAPRFGFAYDLKGDGRTVIRGGYGIFYDAISAYVVGAATPYHYSATYTVPIGGFSDPLQGYNPVPANFTPANAAGGFTAPYSIYFPDKNFTTPYTQSINIGVLQRIRRHGYFEADYIAKLSRHQTITADQNPAIYDCSGAWYQSNPSVYCPMDMATGVTDASYKARVVYPNFSYGGYGAQTLMTVGTANYQGLQMIGGMRGGKVLTVQASYTYSKSRDELSNGLTTQTTLADVWPTVNPKYNYGYSDFDARHVLNLSWVITFPPRPIGSRFDRLVMRAVARWQFSGYYSAHTGMPFIVTSGGDYALNGENGQRAVIKAGVSPYLSSGRHRADKVNEYFNTDAFDYPKLGTLSPVPRNYMRGPGFISNNMAIGRNFNLDKRFALIFRADAFNVFNTPNLSNPVGIFSKSAGAQYGKVLSTAGTNGAVNTNGRRMQLSLSLRY